MKLVQAEEIESQRLMKKLEATNPEILLDIKEYKGQSDLLTESLLVTDAAVKAQATIADDSVDSVDVLLSAACTTIVGLFVRATTVATTAEDKVMEKLFKRSFTYFYRNSKEINIQKLDAAVLLLEGKSGILKTILPAEYIAVKAEIDLYRTHKNIPREEVVTKKADGTDVLSLSVQNGKKIKDLMIKLVKNEYKVTNSALADKAALLGKPIQLGKGHNVGSYSVINISTGDAIGNTVVTEVRTTKKKKKVITKVFTTDENGLIPFSKHVLGSAVLKVVIPGYLNASMTVIFKKNDTNEFVIGMTRVLPK